MSGPIVPYFRDFEKTVKDFTGNFFPKQHSWEITVKDKFKNDNTFYCNPKASVVGGKQSLNAEIGFQAACTGAIKVEAKSNTNPILDSKWTVSYELPCKQKLTVSLQKRQAGEHQCPVDYTLSQEGSAKLPKALNDRLFSNSFPRTVSMHHTLNNDQLDVGYGVAAANHCFFGLGSQYKLKSNVCNWRIASKYHHPNSGMDVYVAAEKLSKIHLGFQLPMSKSLFQSNVPTVIGAKAAFNPRKLNDLSLEGVCEVQLPQCQGHSLKVKVNQKKEVVLSFVAKAAKGWTAAISVDQNCHTGLSFTHS